MLSISEILKLRRTALIAYRFDSEDSARKMLGEHYEWGRGIWIGSSLYVPHPLAFELPTSKRLLVDHVAESAARKLRESPKSYILSQGKKYDREIACLVTEGPQRFHCLQPVPWSYYALFGKSSMRDCYIAWEWPDEKVESITKGETTLIALTRGKGAFFGRELTYDKDGWIDGCVDYLVLLSVNLMSDALKKEHRLISSLKPKTGQSPNPLTGAEIKIGTLPLGEWDSVIKRAKEGYARSCAPYPREKEEVFQSFLRQETLARRNIDEPPHWNTVDELPLRDKVEWIRQMILHKLRRIRFAVKRQFLPTYSQRIEKMDIAAALATVWEPWHLMTIITVKLSPTVDRYETIVGKVLYRAEYVKPNTWKQPWSSARAQRIMAFGKGFVQPHCPDDWD